MFKKPYQDFKDEDHYVGNIWGWKVSIISGVGLVLLLGLFWYRYTYHYVPVSERSSEEEHPLFKNAEKDPKTKELKEIERENEN